MDTTDAWDTDRTPTAARAAGTGPVVGLAASCHPVPAVAVTGLVTGSAVAAGHTAAGCALVAGAVLTGQLSVGWCNDAFDAARDAAAGRHGKPVAAGTVRPRTVWIAAWAALALCVPLSLAAGPLAGTVHLAGVAAAWAYDLWWKATVWSWLPYAVGFASLPAFVTLGLPGGPWPAWWVVAAAALLGAGAHLADTLPDIAADLAVGVRGLPHRLGAPAVRRVLPAVLVAATAVLTLGPPGPPSAPGTTALATAALTTLTGSTLAHRHPGAPFAAAVLVAGVDVALLLVEGAVTG
ncbi:UbiA family prenyltransferase [Streptomyces sp. URMC 126]|uniref:UbiA family prenyltransferase n=1 Tax=Streptomyces sp. URMC 126 TaxID=3423401 RepID=UPI003F1BE5C0